MQPPLTVVDLFCGAGGMSLGFRAAGFKVVWAADNNEAAARTYRENLGEHVACEPVTLDTDPPEATVIADGPLPRRHTPPCHASFRHRHVAATWTSLR